MKSPGVTFVRWYVKPLLHGLLLIPFMLLVYGFVQNRLGVNPVETLTHETGEWGLRILLLTLAVTPLIRLSQSPWLAHLRRMIGLYCFFYVLLHFLIYLLFDLSLDFGFLIEDIIERPYITVGFGSFVILFLLAITSPIAVRRRMAKNWIYLHRLIYIAGILAVVHFLWITRVDDTEPLIYAIILGILMAARLVRFISPQQRQKRHQTKRQNVCPDATTTAR